MCRRAMGCREVGRSRTRQVTCTRFAGRRALAMPHLCGIVDTQAEAQLPAFGASTSLYVRSGVDFNSRALRVQRRC